MCQYGAKAKQVFYTHSAWGVYWNHRKMATEKQQHAMIISSLCAVLHKRSQCCHNESRWYIWINGQWATNRERVIQFRCHTVHQNRETEKKIRSHETMLLAGGHEKSRKMKFIWSRSDFVIRYRSRRDVSSRRSMAYILLVDGWGPRSWLRDWRCCCCEFQGSALMGDRQHISAMIPPHIISPPFAYIELEYIRYETLELNVR